MGFPFILKYTSKSNSNRTLHLRREVFAHLFLEPDFVKRDAMLQRIVDSTAKKPVPILSNSSLNREIPRKKLFYIFRKAVVLRITSHANILYTSQ